MFSKFSFLTLLLGIFLCLESGLQSFRVRDVYAWKLRGYEGAPRIELYWTEAERDAAVANCVAFLREHQASFVYSPERAYINTQ